MAYAFASASSQNLLAASTPVTGVPLTISARCRTSISPAILCAVETSNGSGRVYLTSGYNSTAQVLPGVVDSSGTIGQSTGSRSEDLRGVWYAAAGVYSSITSRIPYLNGGSGSGTFNATYTENTTSVTTTTPNQIRIGARYNGSSVGAYFDGDISELAIWNVALGVDEIVSLSRGFKPPRIRPQSLVFYAPLIRTAIDFRGGVSITNNNSATVSNHARVY